MKPLDSYRAVICDLDGTLYYQTPVRVYMLVDMLLHFWRFSDFLTVRRYRKLYAEGKTEKERFAVLPENAPDIIREWMLERPLPAVRHSRNRILISTLEKAQEDGIRVYVYSDYPVTEKLKALGFVPDAAYSAEDVHCMKPSAEGIRRVLSKDGFQPSDCLVIGDRIDKDGALAENLKADFLLLSGSSRKRKKQYGQIPLSMECQE